MNTSVKLSDWQELLVSVENHQGVYKIPMETLRQLEGAQRVGKHILSAIEDKLRTLGLGHLPESLPNRQQQSVLLYRLGTPASEVIQAVKAQTASDEAYDGLYRLNSMQDPESVVSKERLEEAVAEATQAIEIIRVLALVGE